MGFFKKYEKNFKLKKSFLCVGLDPDPEKIPLQFLESTNPLLSFCLWIIEETAPYAVAFKPNCAFFEAAGVQGLEALHGVCQAINQLEIPLILDAKRGDIGNTASYYAKAAFEYLKADAVTLAPYMGFDSIKPFAQYQDKVSFVLGLTSNPSAQDFEKLLLQNQKPLYQEVMQKVLEWNQKTHNLGLVLGATQEEELQTLAGSFKNIPLLVPGVGTQGGSLEQVISYLYQENPLCINISRGILYAPSPKEAAFQYVQEMQGFMGVI